MQKVAQLRSFRIGCLALLLALMGCAGERLAVPNIPESADPTQEISRLETSMEQAKQNHTDVLAPRHYSESRKALDDAKKLRSENKSNKDILHKVAEGDAYLGRATELSAVAQASIGEVIAARKDALAAQGPTPVKEFSEADEKFKEITVSMEKGHSQIPHQDKMALINEYKHAELKGIQQVSMGESLKQIQDAKNEGAKKWAPNVLAQTEKQTNQLNELIQRDPKNTQEINKEASRLKEQANLLLSVTRQAKVVSSGNPEDVALRLEMQRKQVANLKTGEAESREILERKDQQVATLQKESDLNTQFREIRARFSPEEADVLRMDNKIVIRLKGLHFPVAGKNIPSRDFALLNKLGDTVKGFEGSQVTVEGHTDSKGSQSANLQLSEMRAEAVKDYLVANQAVPEGKVMAEGKGFSKPIASNRTKEGRAQNRRVDVTIETQAIG